MKSSIKIYIFISFVSFFSCKTNYSEIEFLQNENKYNQLFELLKDCEFEIITLKNISKFECIDSSKIEFLISGFNQINILKIKKLDEGIIFVKSQDFFGWHCGYFKRFENTGMESLEYFNITHIKNDWFIYIES